MPDGATDIGSLRPSWLDVSQDFEPTKTVFRYALSEDGALVEGVSAGHLFAGDEIICVIDNNEVMLSSPNLGVKPVPIDALGLSEKDKMNLLGQALFQYAKNGYDPDPSSARAAACHVVEDKSKDRGDGKPTQRIFIAANANHRARSQRPDAEAVALSVAKNIIGVGNFEVKETYLTLDHAKSNGTIITPCGTCREELTNKAYIAQDALLYCIPYQEPRPFQKLGEEAEMPPFIATTVFEVDDQSDKRHPDPSTTKSGFAFKQKTMDLVPYKNIAFPDEMAGEATTDIMRQGRAWATSGDNSLSDFNPLPIQPKDLALLHQTGRGSELPYIKEPGSDKVSLPLVNKFLANKIKAAYNNLTGREGAAQIAPEDIVKIRASVVHLKSGQCYASMYIDGEGLGAKPLGEMSALSNAFNPTNVDEVYVMEYNPVYMDERMDVRGPNARAVYPEALDRLYKSAKHSEGEWTRRTQEGRDERISSKCMVHQIPLNDGSLETKALQELTQKVTIEELYPGPYKAPNGMAAGCC